MAFKKHTVQTRPLARSERLIVEQIDDETVIYDDDSKTAHALKPVAAAVFTYATGEHTPAEIAELASYRLETVVTEADVTDALEQLDGASLLAAPLGDGLSRRDALKTFAATGAAVTAGTMLVTSVGTAAAQTTITYCTGWSNSTSGGNSWWCSDNAAGGGGPIFESTATGLTASNGSCTICSSNTYCGSGHSCCCAPCDYHDGYTCCQPVCFTESTCPTDTLAVTMTSGTGGGAILCPTDYALYNQGGYQTKCCAVGGSGNSGICPDKNSNNECTGGGGGA